ncbi:hypothetical protein [Paenibacillus sabinae]|uniref:hypothetical protein n=1 Tax=Paenibacillus sabinae TaxID=365617 RepID=UPI00130E9533|nr:hypothetical protein [Paenibacillus sabinae]
MVWFWHQGENADFRVRVVGPVNLRISYHEDGNTRRFGLRRPGRQYKGETI